MIIFNKRDGQQSKKKDHIEDSKGSTLKDFLTNIRFIKEYLIETRKIELRNSDLVIKLIEASAIKEFISKHNLVVLGENIADSLSEFTNGTLMAYPKENGDYQCVLTTYSYSNSRSVAKPTVIYFTLQRNLLNKISLRFLPTIDTQNGFQLVVEPQEVLKKCIELSTNLINKILQNENPEL